MNPSSHEPLHSHSLCVIGHPVAHSLSPLMHTTAFKALGLDWTYAAVDVEPSALKETVRGFVGRGLAGFNVTIPHKETVIPFLDELDGEAKDIGAVNTVKIDGGRTKGYNTDVAGIVRSLDPFRNIIGEKRAVVLGTGGAARAVIYSLVNHFKVAGLHVVSRSEQKARDFVGEFSRRLSDPSLTGVGEAYSELSNVVSDAALIVNATPVGMPPQMGASPLNENVRFHGGQIVFDLIYAPLKTRLLKRAEEEGAHIIGGFEMLMHQGAKAFELWTGKEMPMEIVREVVEGKLKGQINDKVQMPNE